MKTHYASCLCRKSALLLFLTLVTSLLRNSPISIGVVDGTSESERFVHNFVNVPPHGNWTFIEKPMFPVRFNQSQIPLDSNWTVVCPLTTNHTYHVYCYGEWIDHSSNPSTDYDIYVYNPSGELEGYHTESAGLPEHLGTSVEEPFFVPKYTGNYSCILRNDPRESRASKPATLMIIENAECNKWQEIFIQGQENNMPVFNTGWAFEFVTDSQHIEIPVKVPETLDMYEARLYLMGNPAAKMGEMLNNVPLPWEQGLYGKISQTYGGYNLESEEYRGLAYASCEFYGQGMLINYTSPVKGTSLYHLVLIGEKGAGKIDFLIKTEFGKARLDPINPPQLVTPENDATLTFASSCTDLRNATLNYSVDNWKNLTALNVQLNDKRTCSAVIPSQPAGTNVEYKVEATDVLENHLVYRGNYPVKYVSQLNLTLKTETISIGGNITLTGLLTPPNENLAITLIYTHTNETLQQPVYTQPDGAFTATLRPSKEGNWMVQAVFRGTDELYGSSSPHRTFNVTPPSFITQYSMYIVAGAGVGIAVAAVVYIKKRRE